MSANTIVNKDISPVTDVVDDAVGVEKSHWFVAIVNHNSEKKGSTQLDKIGITNYVPIQKEIRIWKNGRKAKVDRVVIPSTIFIYCTELQRREIVGLPFVNRFMTNKAGTSKNGTNKPLAIIPDSEIERLKFMLGQSDFPIEITEKSFRNGDKVRVIRGSLAGLEGEVMDLKNTKSELIVALDFFGCARLSIDTINLQLIN
ncbi:MAG: UpxY family transcription antiterminator [Muribaculaceae bacterium]|nr:UpxY family transcription antiterminator [Muribaculaceae bacterium]